jgi:hypothetical protein
MTLPDWLGPPADVIGGLVALEVMAARSEDAVVWLESATPGAARGEVGVSPPMRHTIPASVLIDPMAPLQGDLIAEVFWATADGEVAREVGRFPVQDGEAVYYGPPLEDDLRWAIRIREANTGRSPFARDRYAGCRVPNRA